MVLDGDLEGSGPLGTATRQGQIAQEGAVSNRPGRATGQAELAEPGTIAGVEHTQIGSSGACVGRIAVVRTAVSWADSDLVAGKIRIDRRHRCMHGAENRDRAAQERACASCAKQLYIHSVSTWRRPGDRYGEAGLKWLQWCAGVRGCIERDLHLGRA